MTTAILKCNHIPRSLLINYSFMDSLFLLHGTFLYPFFKITKRYHNYSVSCLCSHKPRGRAKVKLWKVPCCLPWLWSFSYSFNSCYPPIPARRTMLGTPSNGTCTLCLPDLVVSRQWWQEWRLPGVSPLLSKSTAHFPLWFSFNSAVRWKVWPHKEYIWVEAKRSLLTYKVSLSSQFHGKHSTGWVQPKDNYLLHISKYIIQYLHL